MKLTNKLKSLKLSLVLVVPFSFALGIVSCKDVPKDAGAAKEAAKETAREATKDAVDVVPTDAKGVASATITQMGKLAEILEKVTDIETAKAALPDMGKIGSVLSDLKEKGKVMDGDYNLEKTLMENADISMKFVEVQSKMIRKLNALKKDHPEAAKIISEKLSEVNKQ